MAFPDYSYDVYEDFEDALGVNWAETDNDNNIDANSAAASYAGAAGLLWNLRGDTGGGEDFFLGYDMGAARDDISYGCWVRLPSSGSDYAFEAITHAYNQSSMGTNITRLYFSRSSGVYSFRLRGADFGSGITISADTWYWITVHSKRNDTSDINVYGTNEALVGTDSVVGRDTASCSALTLGTDTAVDQNIDFYVDDLVIDWTDATFPLLGWESAPAGIVVLRRRRSN